jgi:phosphatidylglycerophosphatase C
VTPAPPVVAAFDFDGTLTRGGSIWPFLVALRGRRRVAAAAAAGAGSLALAAALGGGHADRAKEALLRRTLAGLDVEEFSAAAAAFGRAHYRRHARADVADRLEWHRARGHRLVIVSASLECYLAPVGEDLGVDAVVATRLAVDDHGRLTGGYDGRNCRGPEKLARLRRWIDDAPIDDTTPIDGATGASAINGVLWAYGNSDGDRQLLAGADVGVDVGRLGRFGALRRFPRLSDLPEADADLGVTAGDGA